MPTLRRAATQGAEVAVEYGGGDPAELVALAHHVAERVNSAAECSIAPDRPGVLRVWFTKRVAK